MKIHYFRRTLSVAIPLVLSQLIFTLCGFIGILMLAHLGHDVLAASGLLFSTQVMIVIICISPLFSLSVIFAQAYGKGETKEIGNMLQQGWALSLLLSVIMIVLYLLIQPLLLFMGQDPVLIKIIMPYFHIAVWGMPAYTINLCNSQLCYGINKQKLNLFILTIQVCITLLVAYILINGKLGAPMMGVAGWGVAFVVGVWSQLLLMAICFYWQTDFIRFSIFKTHLRNNWQHLRLVFKIGWPIMVQMGGEVSSFAFITYMVGWMGKVPLAAMQVVLQYIMIMVIPIIGITIAGGVLVGQSVGAKNYYDAKKFGNNTLGLCLIFTFLVSMIFMIFPKQLARLYLSPLEPNYLSLMHMIRILFLIIIVSQLFDNLRNTITGVLRGVFDTRVPMVIGLLTVWVIRIPLADILGFKFHYGIYGIAWSGFVTMSIAAVWLLLRWHKTCKNMTMKESQKVPIITS